MRPFIAVDCKEQKNYLKSIQSQLPIKESKLKIVSDFHITLKFLGKTPKNEIIEIINKLKGIKFKEFNFSLDNIGFFPNDNYIRVIWLGTKENSEIMNLQKIIDKTIKTKNDFKFKPHITLARVKQVTDRDNFFNKIYNIKYEEKTINVKSFKLMNSTLTPLGPIYETIEEFKCSQE